MIDWGLATRRQMIGGGARSRRGPLIDKSLFSWPPVEVRAVAAAVRVKSPCFCCPRCKRAQSPWPSECQVPVLVAPGANARSRRGRLNEKSLFWLPPVEARAVAVVV